jgi:hypothetical protein
MPSPDWLIWGAIAILAVLLWPIRNWIRRNYDRDDDRDDDRRNYDRDDS